MHLFETKRLGLRELSFSDLDFIAEMMGDAEVMTYYPKVLTRAEARGWLVRQLTRYETDGHGLWLVTDSQSGEPVGQVGLLEQQVDGAKMTEVGYLLHRRYWKKGYATEAALASINYGFKKLGRDRIIALIRPENQPSIRVASRLGMTPGSETRHGGYPHIIYSQTREGWQSAQ